ncbi:MAG: hypothetical protein SOW48_02960 [Peptoniphilaceae bacterium]|nr:hypothetical protein [Peptoniphilaceae bacterium]MCI6659914.1 hypothetical protein [Peptoniphilaceae bacterium]MDD7433753.1 hypothetical protein [Peptoniphilaceae bacterium]MDD7543378.1 hypothetical protein [Peptoniphilaceae bacterium]MDY3075588.1 hypothetical protein [Peptoniphilaceae bacterium]
MAKYTLETTVAELIDTPETRAIIEEIMPQVLEHPLLEVGRTFKFQDAIPYIEDMIEEGDIEKFQARLEELG